MAHIFITDPNIVFLLMTIGLYGLIYELASPGAFFPGITGAICVLLAVLSIAGMPVNYFGLLLMIAGIGCMTGEAFSRSFGVLGIVGAVCFAIGGTFLIDRMAGHPVSPWLICSMTVISLAVLSVGLKLVLRTRKRSVSTGIEGLHNSTGEIVSWSGSEGEVMAAGSVWKARSAAAYAMKKGDKVKILSVDGLCLIIQPHT